MIPKDKGRKWWTFSPGGKSYMSSPCLFFPPSIVSTNHLFNVLLSCWGIYCWKWRVAGLSVFATRSLHQSSLHLHVGKGTITMPLFGLLGGSLSHRDVHGGGSSSSHRAELRRGCDFLFGGWLLPSLTLFVSLWWCSFHSRREPVFLWHYWAVYCFSILHGGSWAVDCCVFFHVFPGLCLFPLRTSWELCFPLLCLCKFSIHWMEEMCAVGS